MSEYLWSKTREYEALLAADLAGADPTNEDGEICLQMARAYLEDGRHFLDGTDLANALAAFAYGHGWLDAGERLGVVEVATRERAV
ncbi:MAG: DUF357 domain-containing protein [Halobacteriales archaeon]